MHDCLALSMLFRLIFTRAWEDIAMPWTFGALVRARTDYMRALAAAAQWLDTALVTGNARHQQTADICRSIAQERLVVLEQLEAAAPPPSAGQDDGDWRGNIIAELHSECRQALTPVTNALKVAAE
jgi:predicted nucleotidyltransferase